MSDTIVEELEPGIHSITLNRPHRRNARAMRLLIELHGIIDELAVRPRRPGRHRAGRGLVVVRWRGHEGSGGRRADDLAAHPLGRLFRARRAPPRAASWRRS